MRPWMPLVLVAVLLSLVSCSKSRPEPADLLLVNGSVYTLAWSEPDLEGRPADDAPYEEGRGWSPDAEAVAIRGGEVVFVGDTAEAKKLAGPDTLTIDLDGAAVIPGLVESHTHVAELGRSLSEVDLTGVDTEPDAIARVVARAETTPAGEWIIGHGWDEGAWADRYPTMERLSAAVPDHPVLLGSLHGFAVWGNRAAFEAAGIDATTADPPGGEIRLDESGEATGLLLNRATRLLRDAVPPASLETREARVVAGLNEVARGGFVAVHEAGVPGETLEALVSLDAKGALPIRVYAMLSAREPALMDDWVKRGPSSGDGMLAVRSVKAYYDGALGSRGARLLDDYADRAGHRGVSGGEYGFDSDRVRAMMAAGFQVGIHAIGDAGNREVLDFIESVLDEHPDARSGRHRIEHAQVLHPADVDRFAELDVVASMQPPHAMEDKAWAEDRLGSKRVLGAYAWRTLRRSGARLAFNSDLPGSDHDIFYGLHSAIARRDKEWRPDGGWYPEQRMTAEEAIRGYTTWGAFAAFEEERSGVIAPGYRADLTVIDLDPFVTGDTDPGRLLEGEVLGTIVGGEIVHARGALLDR